MNRQPVITACALLLLAAGLWAGTATGGDDHKITICHASGLAGTTKYETLTIDKHAVYGPAGHFYENGTPRAGHEQDYIGACRTDTTPTDTTPTNTTPTDTTPTTPTTTTTTTPPPPRLCPDGQPPTPGEGAYDPNDDCARPPATVPPAATTPAAPPVATAPPVTTAPPSVTPPTKPPVAKPKPIVKPKPKIVAKPKPKQPKLTGNPKTDKCKPMKGGTLNCNGTVVVPGSG